MLVLLFGQLNKKYRVNAGATLLEKMGGALQRTATSAVEMGMAKAPKACPPHLGNIWGLLSF
jgi:hypothetical protein